MRGPPWSLACPLPRLLRVERRLINRSPLKSCFPSAVVMQMFPHRRVPPYLPAGGRDTESCSQRSCDDERRRTQSQTFRSIVIACQAENFSSISIYAAIFNIWQFDPRLQYIYLCFLLPKIEQRKGTVVVMN